MPLTTKLSYLQVFRALAAGLVVVAHMAKEVSAQTDFAGNAVLHQLRSGTFGVDLFFVISGFIMVYTTRNAPGGSGDAADFLKRRLLRIVPVYWFYTSLFLAVALLHPSTLNHSAADLTHVISSYLFVPFARPEDGSMEPVFGLGWTLNYEMYFYVVFALFLLLPRRHLLPVLLVYFVITVLIGVVFDRDAMMLWYWTRTNVLEFAYGAVIAQMFLRKIEISPLVSILAITIALIIWQVAYSHYSYGVEAADLRGYVWGIPAALLVGAIALCTPLREAVEGNRFVSKLVPIGDSSYSLYLSHMFIVRIVTLVMPVAVFGLFYPAVFIVITFGLCVIVAHFSYRWLELIAVERGRSLIAVRGFAKGE